MSTETTPGGTRRFHLGDLLSVTTGRLVSPNHMDGVYTVVDYVTGESHMTHQLPRACREVTPWLLEQHPWLLEVEIDFDIPSGASVAERGRIVWAWLDRATDRWGTLHDVRPLPVGSYVGRDPIEELLEMAGHKPIIGVVVDPSR